MLRILIAAVLGGLLLYAWGMVSWVALPWHEEAMGSLFNEGPTMEWIGQQVPEPGLYAFPAWPDPMTDEAYETFEDRHEAGPVGMLVIAEGGPVMPPTVMASGLGINILTAFIAACLLATAGLRGYATRLGFVIALGLLIGVTADGLYWNWLWMPTDHTLLMMGDRIAGMLLAGIAIAAIVRPRKAEPEAAEATTA